MRTANTETEKIPKLGKPAGTSQHIPKRQFLNGARCARYRLSGTGRTPPCPRWAGPRSIFFFCFKETKNNTCTCHGSNKGSPS